MKKPSPCWSTHSLDQVVALKKKKRAGVVIGDRPEISNKGVGRGKGISKVSSLRTSTRMILVAEIGKLEKNSIEGPTTFISLTVFGLHVYF